MVYAPVLLLQPWRWDDPVMTASDSDRYARLAYLLGIVGNGSFIVLYLVTRTIGIPFFGPEAGEVEPITLLGLASKATEIALVACLVVLTRRTKAAASAM